MSEEKEVSIVGSFLIAGILFYLPPLLYILFYGKNLASIGLTTYNFKLYAFFGFILGLTLTVSFFEILKIFKVPDYKLIDKEKSLPYLITKKRGLLHAIFVLVIYTFFFQALGEELLFRAFLINMLSPHTGVKFAIVLAALVFMLFHVNFIRLLGKKKGIFGLVYIFIIGLILGLFYVSSGSIILCWVAHSTTNSISFSYSIKFYKNFREATSQK